MSSNPARLKQLLQKYLLSKCSEEELHEFWQLIQNPKDIEIVSNQLKKFWDEAVKEENDPVSKPDWKNIYQSIKAKKGLGRKEDNTDEKDGYLKMVASINSWYKILYPGCIATMKHLLCHSLVRSNRYSAWRSQHYYLNILNC